MGKPTQQVLVASSEENLIKQIKAILTKNDLNPIIFTSGKEAINYSQEESIPLALIDLHLEDMPGLEVLKSIKKFSPDIECITLVDSRNDALAIQCAKLKAFTLHKDPLFEEHLSLVINCALEKVDPSQAVSKVDERFFSFINKFQDGIAYVSLEGYIIGFNNAFLKMVGYSAEELKKKTFQDLTPKKWHEMEEKIVNENILARGFSGLYEKEYIHKDGTIFPVEVNAYLSRDSEGKPESMWAFVRNISTRKEAEAALHRQLQEVTALQNITAAGSTAETVDELLYAATRILGDSLYKNDFGILLYDDEKNVLHSHFSYNRELIKSEYEKTGLPIELGITGRAIRTRVPQRVADVTKDKDYFNAYKNTRSELAVPIILNNKVFGVINSESPIAGFYTPDDEKMLITLANQLAASISRIQLNISEKQRTKEITALYETAISTSSITDTDTLYRKIYDQVRNLFPLDTFFLAEYDPEDESIMTALVMEKGKPLKEWMGNRFEKSGSGLIGWVIQQRQPFLSSDLTAEILPVKTQSNDQPARSWLGVPLINKGKVVGGLSIQSFEPNVFSENDQRLLESLAAQLASAVDNARLSEMNRHQINRLKALHDIDLAINSSLDLRVTLNILLDQVIEKLEVDSAVVMLHNPKSNMLEYAASRGFRTQSIEAYKLPMGESHSGKAAMERHLIQAFNLDDADEDLAYANLMQAENFVSYYSVPLVAKGQVKGVLDIFNRTLLNPDQEWFNFLETLGGQAAIAIDNTCLLENLHQSNVELRSAYDTTLEGWSRALDLRDKETEGHTQRVVEMTLNIGRTLGISEEELVQTRRGALLHDIGKMGIPDAILLKPGPLSEEEWVIMRQHPVYAYQLLYPIEHLRAALDIPYCHHERWDGSGYPRHLKGEEIPLPGRIFAVVDVWDALTSDRPYRKAWTSKKALDYIQENKGKLFDPQIVEIFMTLIRSELINHGV